MNANNPLSTAFLRALYAAIIAAAIALLTTLQQTDDTRAAVITGLLSGLGVLAARGGLEGIYDQHRAATNDQKPSDVGFDMLVKPKPRG